MEFGVHNEDHREIRSAILLHFQKQVWQEKRTPSSVAVVHNPPEKSMVRTTRRSTQAAWDAQQAEWAKHAEWKSQQAESKRLEANPNEEEWDAAEALLGIADGRQAIRREVAREKGADVVLLCLTGGGKVERQDRFSTLPARGQGIKSEGRGGSGIENEAGRRRSRRTTKSLMVVLRLPRRRAEVKQERRAEDENESTEWEEAMKAEDGETDNVLSSLARWRPMELGYGTDGIKMSLSRTVPSANASIRPSPAIAIDQLLSSNKPEVLTAGVPLSSTELVSLRLVATPEYDQLLRDTHKPSRSSTSTPTSLYAPTSSSDDSRGESNSSVGSCTSNPHLANLDKTTPRSGLDSLSKDTHRRSKFLDVVLNRENSAYSNHSDVGASPVGLSKDNADDLNYEMPRALPSCAHDDPSEAMMAQREDSRTAEDSGSTSTYEQKVVDTSATPSGSLLAQLEVPEHEQQSSAHYNDQAPQDTPTKPATVSDEAISASRSEMDITLDHQDQQLCEAKDNRVSQSANCCGDLELMHMDCESTDQVQSWERSDYFLKFNTPTKPFGAVSYEDNADPEASISWIETALERRQLAVRHPDLECDQCLENGIEEGSQEIMIDDFPDLDDSAVLTVDAAMAECPGLSLEMLSDADESGPASVDHHMSPLKQDAICVSETEDHNRVERHTPIVVEVDVDHDWRQSTVCFGRDAETGDVVELSLASRVGCNLGSELDDGGDEVHEFERKPEIASGPGIGDGLRVDEPLLFAEPLAAGKQGDESEEEDRMILDEQPLTPPLTLSSTTALQTEASAQGDQDPIKSPRPMRLHGEPGRQELLLKTKMVAPRSTRFPSKSQLRQAIKKEKKRERLQSKQTTMPARSDAGVQFGRVVKQKGGVGGSGGKGGKGGMKKKGMR